MNVIHDNYRRIILRYEPKEPISIGVKCSTSYGSFTAVSSKIKTC